MKEENRTIPHPRLTRSEIEEWRYMLLRDYKADDSITDVKNAVEINALCDLAISALPLDTGSVTEGMSDSGLELTHLVQLLTDPENQPHQYVGCSERLRKYLLILGAK